MANVWLGPTISRVNGELDILEDSCLEERLSITCFLGPSDSKPPPLGLKILAFMAAFVHRLSQPFLSLLRPRMTREHIRVAL